MSQTRQYEEHGQQIFQKFFEGMHQVSQGTPVAKGSGPVGYAFKQVVPVSELSF
jgi:hypothetical protein